MTAIYAYASKTKRLGFLAADNIEYTRKTIDDKVFLVNGRFAIAVCGSDIVIHAIEVLTKFQGFTGSGKPDSSEQVIRLVAEYTRELAFGLRPKYQEAVTKRQVQEREWQIVERALTHVIVLDCVSYSLTKGDLGRPLSSEGSPNAPRCIALSNECVLPFALAAQVPCTTPKSIPVFTNTAGIIAYLRRRITADKVVIREIGDLGAYVIVECDKVQYVSAYARPSQYIQRVFTRSIGYEIHNLVLTPNDSARQDANVESD